VGDVIGWVFTALLGLFGTFVLFILICFVVAIATGPGPTSPATAVGIGAQPQIIPNQRPRRHQSRSSRSPHHPLPNRRELPPRTPPAQPSKLSAEIATTDLEIDSRRTMEPSPQSESVQRSIVDSALSFQWDCEEGKMLCGLQDPNGRYIQSFSLENGKILHSEVLPDAILPRSWAVRRGDRT
jgi:hypothetical protein